MSSGTLKLFCLLERASLWPTTGAELVLRRWAARGSCSPHVPEKITQPSRHKQTHTHTHTHTHTITLHADIHVHKHTHTLHVDMHTINHLLCPEWDILTGQQLSHKCTHLNLNPICPCTPSCTHKCFISVGQTH